MTDVTKSIGRIGRSPAFKFFLISFVILLLLIPLLMVRGLVSEREGRAREVEADVARVWGGAQTVSGPVLVVPYTVRIETQDGEKRIERLEERRAIFLPDQITAGGKTNSSILHRSIFDVSVYSANITLEGRFPALDMAEVDPGAVAVRWRDAIVAIALTDVSGLKEASRLAVDGHGEINFAPSIGIPGARTSGIHARLADAAVLIPASGEAPSSFAFRLKLDFSGSTSLAFAPAARETRVALASDWPHPSFIGAFLPVERSVTAEGFTAAWRVPHLARSLPTSWRLSEGGIERFDPYNFGVTYYQPVEFYDLVTRAVKYAVLFLSIAFMAVFVLEIASHRRVHPVQYLFVGMAMIFFYVLLLSLAEHTGFLIAYVVASAATGGMLSAYVGTALKSHRSGLVMLALFSVLYAFLYLILTLEDYALLAGAILGFTSLTVVMFRTLRIDWSAGGDVVGDGPKAAEETR